MLLRCLSPRRSAAAAARWKIASPTDVELWEKSGLLTGSSLDANDGFVHASDARMIRKVASMFFRGKQVRHATGPRRETQRSPTRAEAP